MEKSRVINLLLFKLYSYLLKLLLEYLIISTRETQKTAWINTNCLNCKSFSWEMTALYEEHFSNIIWNTSKESDSHFKLFTSKNFSLHSTAFNQTWSANCIKIDCKLKWYFSNVFNKEISDGTFIVSNFTKINFFS